MFAFCCNVFQRVQKDEFVYVVWFICNSEVVDAWIRKAFFERMLISVTYVCIFICLWYFADPWKMWKLFSLCLKKLLRSSSMMCFDAMFFSGSTEGWVCMCTLVFHFELWRVMEGVNPWSVLRENILTYTDVCTFMVTVFFGPRCFDCNSESLQGWGKMEFILMSQVTRCKEMSEFIS
jgi:hypothetical protein